MGAQPEEERLIVFRSRALQLKLVRFIEVGLAREGWSEEQSHLVCPADFGTCQFEDHVRLKRGDRMQERVGSLVTNLQIFKNVLLG